MISYLLKYSTVNLNLRVYYYSTIYTKKNGFIRPIVFLGLSTHVWIKSLPIVSNINTIFDENPSSNVIWVWEEDEWFRIVYYIKMTKDVCVDTSGKWCFFLCSGMRGGYDACWEVLLWAWWFCFMARRCVVGRYGWSLGYVGGRMRWCYTLMLLVKYKLRWVVRDLG